MSARGPVLSHPVCSLGGMSQTMQTFRFAAKLPVAVGRVVDSMITVFVVV